MFRGSHEHGVDEKGRVPFPARFREVLSAMGQTTVVLVRWPEPCVRLYPLSRWEAVEAKLAGLSEFDPEVHKLRRVVLGECAECELDKQGRILLPPRLRSHAGIEKDALFVGTTHMVELWNPQRWRQTQEELYADPLLVQNVVTRFGL